MNELDREIYIALGLSASLFDQQAEEAAGVGAKGPEKFFAEEAKHVRDLQVKLLHRVLEEKK